MIAPAATKPTAWGIPWVWADKRPSAGSAFRASVAAEHEYARALNNVAREVQRIVAAHGGDPAKAGQLQRALAAYSERLGSWAEGVASTMLRRADLKSQKAFHSAAAKIGRSMRELLAGGGEVSLAFAARLAENVKLIKSIPLEAGQRVAGIVTRGLAEGTRADTLAAAIMETGEVSRARAVLIARTETSKAATALTQARAQSVGSESYIWRTSGDGAVRPSHRDMEGKTVKWSEPVTLDGMTGHAGEFPNCFPASTPVNLANGCHYIWRHFYTGPMVRIDFDGGSVCATPNHPVLTGRGWVPAGAINEGDHIIQCREQAFERVSDNEDDAQTLIGEVFDALLAIVGGECKPGLLFDFHGYVPDADVHTVRADHLLPGNFVPETLKCICQHNLTGADGGVVDSGVVRGHGHVVEPNLPGAAHHGATSLGLHIPHADDVCLAPGPAQDAASGKGLGNGASVHVVPVGQGQFTFSGNVGSSNLAIRQIANSVVTGRNAPRYHNPIGAEPLAEIVRVDANRQRRIFEHDAFTYQALRVSNRIVSEFSGHVFTLQSASGWFSVTASGIIVKHCRCYPEPVIPQEVPA